MNERDRQIIEALDANLRPPNVLRGRGSNQEARELLGALANNYGYRGDPNFADEAGVDILADVAGREALPILENLKKKVGGSIMGGDVDRAIRKHNVR